MRKAIIISAMIFCSFLIIALTIIVIRCNPKDSSIIPPNASPSEFSSFVNYRNGGKVACVGGTLYYTDSNGIRQIKDGTDSFFCRDPHPSYGLRLYGYRDMLYLVSGSDVYTVSPSGKQEKILSHVYDLAIWHDRLFYFVKPDNGTLPHTLLTCRMDGTSPETISAPAGYRISFASYYNLFLFDDNLYVSAEETHQPEHTVFLQISESLSVAADEALTTSVGRGDWSLFTENYVVTNDKISRKTNAYAPNSAKEVSVEGYDYVMSLDPAVFDLATCGDILYVNAFSGHNEKELGVLEGVENDNTLPQAGLWRINVADGTYQKIADNPIYKKMFVFDEKSIYYFDEEKLCQFTLSM